MEVFLAIGVGAVVGEGVDVRSGVSCGRSTGLAVGIWVAVAGGNGIAAVTGMSVGAGGDSGTANDAGGTSVAVAVVPQANIPISSEVSTVISIAGDQRSTPEL